VGRVCNSNQRKKRAKNGLYSSSVDEKGMLMTKTEMHVLTVGERKGLSRRPTAGKDSQSMRSSEFSLDREADAASQCMEESAFAASRVGLMPPEAAVRLSASSAIAAIANAIANKLKCSVLQTAGVTPAANAWLREMARTEQRNPACPPMAQLISVV
jgi:hypothetical protein